MITKRLLRLTTNCVWLFNTQLLYSSFFQSGRPIGVTMFDFQTMCYSSPMMDLCTFMANSTGADVRGPHFEEIFRAYHTELIKVLYENGNMAGTPDDPPEKYS